MNYLIQRGKVRGQVINVPEGLPELLSDVTREVLRCQPTTECLCQFIIDYLHSLIVTREKASVAKSIIDRALHTVDEIISDMCICDIPKAKSEEMALVMEECFRRFLEKRRCEHRQEKEIVKFHEEDMLDELINRCKFSKAELKITRPLIEEAYNRFVLAYMSAGEDAHGTEALYQYFKERDRLRSEAKQLNDAAVRIQANFRGYLVRRLMFIKQKKRKQLHLTPALLDEMDKAARKIQRFYRKHSGFHKHTEPLAPLHKCGSERDWAYADVCSPPSVLSVRSIVSKESPEPEPIAKSTLEAVGQTQVDTTPQPVESATAPEADPAPAAEPEPDPAPAAEPEPDPEPAAEPEPPTAAAEPEAADEIPASAEPAQEPAEEAPPAE